MKCEPLRALRSADASIFWPAVLSFVLACSSEAPVWDTADLPPPGATRGQLAVFVADLDNGTTEYQYFLRVGDDERRLRFEQPPSLDPGAVVDVWARPNSDGELLVTRFETVKTAVATVDSVKQRLINGPAARPRKIAFVMVDIGAGVNTTEAAVTTRLFGVGATDASLRQYYIEASYGRQDLGGQVFGPLKYTMTGCDTSALAKTLKAMVPTGFDHYLWYLGSKNAACAWSGLASLGTPNSPSRDTWYNASTNCVVLVQEPGHNFGMKHSSSLKCPNGVVFEDAPNGTCVHSEYGDSYDPMGRACRHMNSYQKAYQGWYGSCNVIDVTSTGTFTLLPTELPCDGVQSLQIAMPKSRPFARSGGGGADSTVNLTHYYVEMRSGVGFDKGLAPQVQIRVSGDIRLRTQGGLNSWFLDMNPATANLDGLAAGGTYTDPAGTIKITVQAIDAAKATVNVEIQGGTGGPTCQDGTALAAPGPGPESCAAAPSIPGDAPPLSLGDGGVRDGGATTRPTDGGAATAGRRDAASEDVAPPSPDVATMNNPPPPDSGVDRFADAVGSAVATGDGDDGGTSVPSRQVNGGCGCRVDGNQDGGGALPLILVAGLFPIVRRRFRARA